MATIDEIRLANLNLLIAKEGTITAFCTKIGRAHAQISQIKNALKHSKSGKPRVMGDDLARHIESIYGFDPGWMDNPRPGSSTKGAAVYATMDGTGNILSRTLIEDEIKFLRTEEAEQKPYRPSPGDALSVDELLERVGIILAMVPKEDRQAMSDVMAGWAQSGGADSYRRALSAILAGDHRGKAAL